MPAIINHKICDNASACGGISVCPVGAFVYNEQSKKIEIDNEKCISCGACENSCPIGAIGVAQTWEDYEELKNEIENDPRNPEDLFIDRYGADIINEDCLIEIEEIDEKISKESNIIIELFNDDSIMCLLKSIPFTELTRDLNCNNYYRCNVGKQDISKYGVVELPSLIVVKDNTTKVANGYFEHQDKQKLLDNFK